MFQFPIGVRKNQKHNEKNTGSYSFQFPIGVRKWMAMFLFFFPSIVVSIPHRGKEDNEWLWEQMKNGFNSP